MSDRYGGHKADTGCPREDGGLSVIEEAACLGGPNWM